MGVRFATCTGAAGSWAAEDVSIASKVQAVHVLTILHSSFPLCQTTCTDSTHTHTHSCTHTCTHTHTHTYMLTQTHIAHIQCTHTCIHTHARTLSTYILELDIDFDDSGLTDLINGNLYESKILKVRYCSPKHVDGQRACMCGHSFNMHT